MKIKELVADAKAADPGLAELPDGKAAGLVRAVLRRIAGEVGGTGEGTVRVGGLGAFRVRPGGEDEAGKAKAARVVFRPAVPADAPKGGGKGGGKRRGKGKGTPPAG